MATLTTTQPRQTTNPMHYLAQAWQTNRPLTFLGVSMLITLVVTFIGLIVDPRVITGQPAWLKPMKFAVSISIYSFTLLWMLTYIKNRPRVVGFISWVTLIGFVIEMVAIIGQVLRGTTSHFNRATPFDAFVFTWMGNAVVAIWLCCLIVGIYLMFQNLGDSAFGWSLRLGVLIGFIGMGLAFLMVIPTEEQLALAEQTGELPISGAHAVSAPDDAPGLPIVGWSTEGGDLRIGHFIGLHGMQVLPVIGLLLATPAMVGRYTLNGRRLLVFIAGFAYLGITLLLTWQALRGQSIIAPDMVTLGALAILTAVTGIATYVTLKIFKMPTASNSGN
ncbi:MAG: hypothetical protein AAFR81_23455 [Chloroflexota bacterium]